MNTVPWSLVGEVSVNAVPIIDPPAETIGVAKLGLVAVQWPSGRRHLVPTFDARVVTRTLCGLRRDPERATEPVLATSPEPLTDCARCARSLVIDAWRASHPRPTPLPEGQA